MRVTGVSNEQVPGTPGSRRSCRATTTRRGATGDYWYPYAWDTGYLQTDTTVQIETIVYALKGEVLIWSGVSESTNPGSVRKLIQEIAVAVGVDVKKRNVIR